MRLVCSERWPRCNPLLVWSYWGLSLTADVSYVAPVQVVDTLYSADCRTLHSRTLNLLLTVLQLIHVVCFNCSELQWWILVKQMLHAWSWSNHCPQQMLILVGWSACSRFVRELTTRISNCNVLSTHVK